MTAGHRLSTQVTPYLLFVVLGVLVVRIATAQGSISSGSFPYDESVLRQAVVTYEVERANWNLKQTNGPFLKEPEVSPQHVFRRVLRFGNDTNNAFALIWDQPKHKLYLDLNHNQDLTDDNAGAFTSTNTAFAQRFLNIKLPLKTAEGFLPAKLDLHLSSDSGEKWLQAQVISHCLWQGRMTLGTNDWQVVVVDQFLGPGAPAAGKFLLMRPWEFRTNHVYTGTSIWGTREFPQRLSVMGRAFEVERRFENVGSGPSCRLILKPQQPPSTELKLSGEFLSYAVLHETNGYMLVLRGNAPTVTVPQGVYMLDAAMLKKGGAAAYRAEGKPLILNTRTATNLVLGGPLTNWVTLERSGRKLLMNREIRGADGDIYNLAERDNNRPPEFAVYRAGKKVFSGQFEYG